MREIAEEAGIGVSSIYTYFPNQETLFVETTLRGINDFIDRVQKISEKTNKRKMIYKVIQAFIDYISRHDSYFRMMVLFMSQGNLTDESLEKLNSIMRTTLDLFEDIFKSINFKGNTRHLSHYFFATLNGILVTYRKLPGRNEEEVIKHMHDLGKLMGRMILEMSDEKEGI
jgi:AcrR family transcriptional regulator